LLKLKLAGIRAFADYSEFWQFFGEGASAPTPSFILSAWPLLTGRRALLGQAQHPRRPRHAYSPSSIATACSVADRLDLVAKFARIDLCRLADRKVDARSASSGGASAEPVRSRLSAY